MLKKDFINTVGVSVIVPVFNAEATIVETILSIVNQSHKKIEIIVIDDFSTDNSYHVLEDLKLKYPIIKLFRNGRNRGVSYSRNIGLMNCVFDFVSFCDSDDIFVFDKIEKQLVFMLTNNVKFSYTSFYRFRGNILNRKQIILRSKCSRLELYHNTIIVTSTVMYNKSYFRTQKFKDFYYDDFVFWLDLLENDCAYGLSDPLTYYRVTNTGLSGNKFKSIGKVFKTFFILEKRNPLKAVYHFIIWIYFTILKYVFQY
jgi:teichuronic acid biosynthesis glycosyltransferase TuaG